MRYLLDTELICQGYFIGQDSEFLIWEHNSENESVRLDRASRRTGTWCC
jgi:hypothetical protein